MSDFDTDSLKFKAKERWIYGYMDALALFPTTEVSDTPYVPPLMRYIARRMALVATPYWPCTDLHDRS